MMGSIPIMEPLKEQLDPSTGPLQALRTLGTSSYSDLYTPESTTALQPQEALET